ncbi:MAG: AAA family ATPase, partial [Flavobacteriales bacterium]|nr:AAA family ATPase [Flavobacteriales bacterium]
MKIFLIGFMGSGKSTLAKKLANRINYSFLDLDEEIERIEKRSVAEIFEKEGES